MGNWVIVIQGVGQHHNGENGADANNMARNFMKELTEAGHAIDHASITYGGRDLLSLSEDNTNAPSSTVIVEEEDKAKVTTSLVVDRKKKEEGR
jgi:hypothetical protein